MKETPETRAAIGPRIKRARLQAGFSTAMAFADALEVNRNTVYRWERGELIPDIFTLHSIEMVTGASMAWIVSGVQRRTQARPTGLTDWLKTPIGMKASKEAIAFLEGAPVDMYPHVDSSFYDYLFLAYEQKLSPQDAVLAAAFTESKRPKKEP